MSEFDPATLHNAIRGVAASSEPAVALPQGPVRPSASPALLEMDRWTFTQRTAGGRQRSRSRSLRITKLSLPVRKQSGSPAKAKAANASSRQRLFVLLGVALVLAVAFLKLR